uniref:Uncharacterized protein n=1 Tax=Parascaris univalens TaxID=6257 RepID=A0A914ZZJ0_PARUN
MTEMNTATTYGSVTAHDWVEVSQENDRIDTNQRVSRFKNILTYSGNTAVMGLSVMAFPYRCTKKRPHSASSSLQLIQAMQYSNAFYTRKFENMITERSLIHMS